MKKSIYTKLLIVCGLFIMLASCTKEDISTEHMQSDLSEAEIYLNTHSSSPGIMFSYNVLNTDTKVLNSFLIDNEGQIRTNTKQGFSVRSNVVLSYDELQSMKDESKVVADQEVTLDELVQNFLLMRTADRLSYDKSIEKEGPQMHTAVYAYYYDQTQTYTTTSTNECEGESTTTTRTGGGQTTGSYRAILLEQKLASDIIQKNESANFTINWINSLVEASSIEFGEN